MEIMKTINLYPLATIVCILLNVANTSAQSEGYENRYIETQDPIPFDSFRYGLFVPPDYDSTVGHHMMLWLHGAGHTDDDYRSWYQPEWQEQYPTIVLTPKCYKSQYDDQRTELTRGAWGDSWVMVERWCIEMAFQALDSVLREYNIDTTKMHVAGSSLGAVGTLYVLASRPGMFASAYAESTAADPERADLVKDTPLWLFHGSDDPTIPVWQSRDMYHAIRDSGGRVVRYKEYRGIGHNIWDYTPLENTLNEWLFAQKLGSVHEAPNEAVGNFSVRLNDNIKPVLSWTAPDDGIGEDEYIWAYQIYRDAELLETVDRDSVRFIDLDAVAGITYSYSVAPINYFFLEAPVSKEIAVTTKKMVAKGNWINVPENFAKIQDAINSSVDGDTILVAPGTYYENLNFRGKNIMLTSHYLFDEDVSFINTTIIDGSKPQSPDTASVVLFLSGEENTAILQGFTITGGEGARIFVLEFNKTNRIGGGILIYQSSPTIRHNIIAFNESINPTGVSYKGGGGICAQQSSAIISNNIIYKNKAEDGGGLLIGPNPGSIRNNIIAYNTTISTAFGGGGILIRGDLGPFTNNTIAFNHSKLGSGIIFRNNPNINIENSIIYGNTTGSSNKQIDGSGTIKITNSNIEGGWAGDGNIDESPLFVDFTPLILQEGSPSIDMGDPNTDNNDWENPNNPGFPLSPALGSLRNDMGAYGGNQYKSMPYLIMVDTKNIIVDNSNINRYFAPGLDTVVISSRIVSPMDQAVDVKVIFKSSDGSVVDSVIMLDDGSKRDSRAGDGRYTAAWLANTEDRYSVDVIVFLKDFNEMVSLENAFNFTTIGAITAIEGEKGSIANKPALEQNFPNPFNQTTSINYSISEPALTSLKVYDLSGKEVRILVNEHQAMGSYTIEFDASSLPGGLYFYKLDAGEFSDIKKLVLTKYLDQIRISQWSPYCPTTCSRDRNLLKGSVVFAFPAPASAHP